MFFLRKEQWQIYSTYCIKELGFPDQVVTPKDEEKLVFKDSDKDSNVAIINDYCDDLNEDYNDKEDTEDEDEDNDDGSTIQIII